MDPELSLWGPKQLPLLLLSFPLISKHNSAQEPLRFWELLRQSTALSSDRYVPLTLTLVLSPVRVTWEAKDTKVPVHHIFTPQLNMIETVYGQSVL